MAKPEKFIQKAIKNPGALTRQAKAAGKTISEFCQNPPSPVAEKRCNLAKTLGKLRKK